MKPDDMSRREAISVAINTITGAHAILGLVAWVICIWELGPLGLFVGLLAAMTLLAIYPFILLSGNIIGWLAHRLFEHSFISVLFAIRVLVVVFELNLLGWCLITIFSISEHSR